VFAQQSLQPKLSRIGAMLVFRMLCGIAQLKFNLNSTYFYSTVLSKWCDETVKKQNVQCQQSTQVCSQCIVG